MPPEMTDQAAVQLLQLLDLYCALPDSAPTVQDDLTIRMLVEDLLASLPPGTEPTLRVVG